MKIVLSRKDFDSSNGNVASPIFLHEDGTLSLYSLPIPMRQAACEYADIQWNQSNLQVLISQLRYRKKTRLPDTAHLDPDLVRDALKNRHRDWRPIFGQRGPQETQLQNMGVNDPAGDRSGRPLFLFFGWYRETKSTNQKYAYVRKSPNIHALFGWLQVEQKITLKDREHRKQVGRLMPWAAKHPHVDCDDDDSVPNAIYVAPKPGSETDRLVLDGRDTGLPASGMFRRFDPGAHRLTREGSTRTNWLLPLWFYRDSAPTLGMHSDVKRWTPNDPEHIRLRTVGRGQEFVFDSRDHEEKQVFDWVECIIRAGQSRCAAK